MFLQTREMGSGHQVTIRLDRIEALIQGKYREVGGEKGREDGFYPSRIILLSGAVLEVYADYRDVLQLLQPT